MDIACRLAREEDFPAVIDCIRDVYKGNYCDPRVFSSGYLRDQHSQNLLLTFVAATPSGEIAATITAFRDPFFPHTLDLGMYMTRPAYRGRGIGSALSGFMLEYITGTDTRCTYAHAVTVDTISQSHMAKIGFQPTGFLFAAYDKRKHEIPYQVESDKLTVAILSLKCNKLEAGTVCLPEELVPFARQVYQSLEAPFRLGEAGEKLAETSQTDFYSSIYHNTGYLKILRAGEDLPQRLEELEAPRREREYQTFNAYLNASDPSAPQGVRVLLEQGYRFAGMQPLCSYYEFLVFFKNTDAAFVPGELQMLPSLEALAERVFALWQKSSPSSGR